MIATIAQAFAAPLREHPEPSWAAVLWVPAGLLAGAAVLLLAFRFGHACGYSNGYLKSLQDREPTTMPNDSAA